jgi:glycosyltransferase involved in cell wall biosynthesis
VTESNPSKPRLLIFIVAYNAETTIRSVLQRIPASLRQYETEILIIDDASRDRTFEKGREVEVEGKLPFKLTVLYNPVNQGYGGNQKIGFHYAVKNGFDFVALVHGDGQYAPEMLPDLIKPLLSGEADAVFGSRMMTRGAALRGGMPLYKFVGNKILTTFQNKVLRASLSEFHSGYRLYSTNALRKIPFHLNSNQFHFDTEIIIQLLFARQRIKEIAIPTYYGDEISHVNGMKYAKDVVIASLRARAQELSLYYDRKFDCLPDDVPTYGAKLGFDSSHVRAIAEIQDGSRVLDIGCASGYVSGALLNKRCHVTGIDTVPLNQDLGLHCFIQHDLNAGPLPLDFQGYDYVLLLDVIEHVLSPDDFAEKLRYAARFSPDTKLIVSTGNIGFVVARLTHLLGQFNYGKRGLLDRTHTRLFTFSTLRQFFEQNGFRIDCEAGVPAPFPLAVGDGLLGRFMLKINRLFINLWKAMFAYQIFFVVRAMPSLEYLLQSAMTSSVERAARSGEVQENQTKIA